MGSFVLRLRVPLFASGYMYYVCVTGKGVCDGKSYAGRLYIKYKCSQARSVKCLLANRCERCISPRYDADDDIYLHIDWRQWENRRASLRWCLIPAHQILPKLPLCVSLCVCECVSVTGRVRCINLVKIL